MKSWRLFAVLSLSLVMGVGCSSGGGKPEAKLIGPDGSEVTSLDVADPVAAEFVGLSANAQYAVRTIDPDETVVCEANVFAGADGTIPVSPYCHLGDKDTDVFLPEGQVDSLISQDKRMDDLFTQTLTIPEGNYTLRLLREAKTVLDTTVPISSKRAWVCSSNAEGMCARSFLKDASNVYATIREGSGIADGTTVDIYVIGDRCNTGFEEGMSLQSVHGGVDTVTVTYTDGLFTTVDPVWGGPKTTGVFDLVVDVDQSGTYTDGDIVEILDPTPDDFTDPGGLCAAGFAVQDEIDPESDVVVQIAMDQNRAYQDVFSRGRGNDVYAQVLSQRRLTHKFGVKKWVVLHQDNWTDGDELIGVIPATLDEVQTGCTNQQRRLIAPVALLSPGCYDIVFDVDADGVYDRGGDAVDNIDLRGQPTCGFIVSDDDVSLTIDSIKDQLNAEVKGQTSESVSAKMTITGAAPAFTNAATVKAYAVSGSQQGPVIVGEMGVGGAFTIGDPNFVPLFAGPNTVYVIVTEGWGEGGRYASAAADVTWTPGGADGGIDFLATVTWTNNTDMDAHFIKPDGVYTGGYPGPSNMTDCSWNNCTEEQNQAIDWTTATGTQTTFDDTSSDAIARMDLDCTEFCSTHTETVWIKSMAEVSPKAGTFLLCVYAFNGTDTPSAQVSVNGVAYPPLTAPTSITTYGGYLTHNMWFAGYVSQDTSGNLTWNAINAVGKNADICKHPEPEE